VGADGPGAPAPEAQAALDEELELVEVEVHRAGLAELGVAADDDGEAERDLPAGRRHLALRRRERAVFQAVPDALGVDRVSDRIPARAVVA
jgi:hypothetical protein